MLHSSLRLHQLVANQGPKPHSISVNLNHIRGPYLTSCIMLTITPRVVSIATLTICGLRCGFTVLQHIPLAELCYLQSQILQTDAAEHECTQWCFDQGSLQLPLPVDIANSTTFRLEARSISYCHALTNHPKSGQSVLSMLDQYTNHHVGNLSSFG